MQLLLAPVLLPASAAVLKANEEATAVKPIAT